MTRIVKVLNIVNLQLQQQRWRQVDGTEQKSKMKVKPWVNMPARVSSLARDLEGRTPFSLTQDGRLWWDGL